MVSLLVEIGKGNMCLNNSISNKTVKAVTKSELLLLLFSIPLMVNVSWSSAQTEANTILLDSLLL